MVNLVLLWINDVTKGHESFKYRVTPDIQNLVNHNKYSQCNFIIKILNYL